MNRLAMVIVLSLEICYFKIIAKSSITKIVFRHNILH
jgi:hypothetical protein